MVDPVLTTQAQLEDARRELMGPWSFGRHSVWMMFICDDRPLPHLTEIADAADPPDTAMLDGLARNLMAVEHEVAPGMPCEVVHLTTRGAIRPVPADVVGIR